MPAGTVTDQRGDRAWRHLSADLGEVEVHAFGVDRGCDNRRADTARRADGAEDTGGVVAVIPHLSMAARNSPESSGRNSPLHSDSVTAKSPRRPDIGEAVEVEINNLLKRLSGGAVAQAFGQRVGPSGIRGL